MMRNVTKLLFDYLEAKRHLWNVYFVSRVRSLQDCGPLDRYEMIDRLLFSALVLDSLDQGPLNSSFRFGLDPIPFLKVMPGKGVEQLKLMVSDPLTGPNRAWNPPITIGSKAVAFDFIEFFDWNRYGHVSYPYYMARVIKCSEFPDYRGRDCLIETKDAEIFLSERKQS